MKSFITLAALIFTITTTAQTNIKITHQAANKVIQGNYDPTNYASSNPIDDHNEILCNMNDLISADSLKSYLVKLETFRTRHTYSDTLSADTGIGAARRWAHAKFKTFSSRNENRLISSYLQFDQPTGGSCGPAFGWKNTLAVLPGSDTANHSVIIIEAHMDSRCESSCDINCFAPGIDDNGSGTALVIELARVMSRFTFKHTLLFVLTIGEEQGLLGAEAMSKYCVDNAIPLKGVLNNDVVGGVICGATSSPPSCPGEGHIDSLQLRLFSNGATNFAYRNFARTVKMYYEEKLKNEVDVPMMLSIINQEDRTGRGGDHIPFRMDGFRNVRLTCANEHGDASVGPGYTDRQHTSGDVLGIDTNGDMTLDQYYVDFNYLSRNALINGMSATLLASGPETPGFIVHDEPDGLRVSITSGFLKEYRIGVRQSPGPNTDFDAVYDMADTTMRIPDLAAGVSYFISVAGIDINNIMSPFSREFLNSNDANTGIGTISTLPHEADCSTVGISDEYIEDQDLAILRCFPNPGNNTLTIEIENIPYTHSKEGILSIHDDMGREIDMQTINLIDKVNFVNYSEYLNPGIYFISLSVDSQIIAGQKVIITE